MSESSGVESIVGKMVAEQLKNMQAQGSTFDPRGGKGEEIDAVTKSILESMSDSGGGYQKVIEADPDLKYIVDTLLKQRLIIPYVAKWLDKTVGTMTKELEKLFEKTFPSPEDEGDGDSS